MHDDTRDEVLSRLAEVIDAVKTKHPVRVAIDGRPAAGKTTLADELALVLRSKGREVIRASVDSFLWPRAQRYRRGMYSPEGCYYDSFDYDALYRVLLDPLGPDGDRRYQVSIYDRATDAVIFRPFTTASADAVLLFDGVFLLRPEQIDRWYLRIYLSVTFEKTLDRARRRDLMQHGSTATIDRFFRERYMPAQELYLTECRPTDHADIIFHNDEPERPRVDWLFRGSAH